MSRAEKIKQRKQEYILHHLKHGVSREGFKKCSKCKKEKQKTEFNLNRSNPDGLRSSCKECNRMRQLLWRYNISEEEYLQMKERQNNRCAICKTEIYLEIDHDHKTEKVRGLLCTKCNNGLGMFRDSKQLLKQAIKYLKGEC